MRTADDERVFNRGTRGAVSRGVTRGQRIGSCDLREPRSSARQLPGMTAKGTVSLPGPCGRAGSVRPDRRARIAGLRANLSWARAAVSAEAVGVESPPQGGAADPQLLRG